MEKQRKNMREAIEFLNQDNKRVTKAIEDLDMEKLITWFIASMLRRMPTSCMTCKFWYNTIDEKEKQEAQKIRCFICKKPSHGCEELTESAWICWTCATLLEDEEDTMIEIQDLVVNSLIKKRENEANRFKAWKKKKIEEKRKQTEKKDDIEIIGSKAPEGEHDETDKNEDDMSIIEESGNKDKGEHKELETEREDCWWWINRTCRLGKCPYLHPDKCETIMETGICTDRNCKLFHPRICNKIRNEGFCSRRNDCWFTHPKKTMQRRDDYDRNNQRDKTWRNGMQSQNRINDERNRNGPNGNFLQQQPQIRGGQQTE